jgi:enoyl-CoA hydratase
MRATWLQPSRSTYKARSPRSRSRTHTLTDPQVRELDRITRELADDPTLRVLVLTGGGEGVFIAHYEVGEIADRAEAQQTTDTTPPAGDTAGLNRFHQISLRLESMRAITVAAINGSAPGGGCEMSLGCDFRLMADGPYPYGLPETIVGIIPGAGGTQRFARLLGTAKALDLILHARLLTPGEAYELGLVHRIFPVDRFREEVDAFVQDLASRAPIALAAAKLATQRGSQVALREGLAMEQAEVGRCMQSRDAAGAMRAWLEGKTYTWRGE